MSPPALDEVEWTVRLDCLKTALFLQVTIKGRGAPLRKPRDSDLRFFPCNHSLKGKYPSR